MSDFEEKRSKHFPHLQDQCFLDHLSSTLYSQIQIDKVFQDLKHNLYANTHSKSAASRLTGDKIERMRSKILRHFHTNHDKYAVIFTAGTTQSLKLIAETFGQNGGTFAYEVKSHTSLVGMREIFSNRDFNIVCLENNPNVNENDDHEHDNCNTTTIQCKENTNKVNLLAMTGMSNFTGKKTPLKWIELGRKGHLYTQQIQYQGQWFVLLDASSLVSCDDLNLNEYSPDFVTISFYKIFGYPTGLGALLVHKDAQNHLYKKYFGGGSVDVLIPNGQFYQGRKKFEERFEDGTIPFLDIISLEHGFSTLKEFWPDMHAVGEHVFSLARILNQQLKLLHYKNGAPLIELYSESDYISSKEQGGVVCFNVYHDDGSFVGYSEILRRAELCGIHLRAGCFCNVGACQQFLKLSNEDLIENWKSGHVCGDSKDIIRQRPTGAVRVSFGYMSNISDVQRLLNMFHQFFVLSNTEIPVVFNCEIQSTTNLLARSDNNLENTTKVTTTTTAPRQPTLEEIQQMSLEELEAVYSIPREEFEQLINSGLTSQKEEILCLCLYPIKCCGVQMSRSWPLSSTGLLYDRSWTIVKDNGEMLSQKIEPKLCCIRPFVDLERDWLIISSDLSSRENFVLDLKTLGTIQGKSYTLKVCDSRVNAFDCGDEISDWISEILHREGCRLLCQNSDRFVMTQNNSKLSLASVGQFLFINLATTTWLKNQIPKVEDLDEVEICYRMRPNIIGNLSSELFEDQAREIVIANDLTLKILEGCARCHVICYDQFTGRRPSNEPLRSLTRLKPKGVTFGVLTFMTDAPKMDKLTCPSPCVAKLF